VKNIGVIEMKKYTPGPWQYKPDLCKDDNVFAGDKRIANVFGAADTWYETEFEANARLIAAAPELLEALKMVLHHGRIDDSESRMTQVAAAITKAEAVSK